MAQTTTTDTPTIGALIRAWRVFRGLKVTELAARAGVRKGYLSEIEHDKRTNPLLGKLEKLVAALEISLQDIQDRRLPPGYDDQTLGQGPLPGMTQSPQPQATAAVGSVVQQLLEQMQALTVAVAQLQADLADQKQRVALPSPALQAQPKDAVQLDTIVGHWQGCAWQYLLQNTPLVLSEGGEPIVLPHDMVALFTMQLRLGKIAAFLSGSADIAVGWWPLRGNFAKTLDLIMFGVSVIKSSVEGNRLTLTLQGDKEDSPWVEMTGTLSEDGFLLRGDYEAEGLLSKYRVSGRFFLEKIYT